MNKRDLFVGKLVLWIPVKKQEYGHGVFKPEAFKIHSLGTDTAHLVGYPDVQIEYSYDSIQTCRERCRQLFSIYTGLPQDAYPEDV